MSCLPKMIGMSYFSDNLSKRLENLGMTKYRLHKLMGLSESIVINVTNGARKPSEEFIKKLASVDELGLTYPELLAWKLTDEYGEDILKEAIEIVKAKRGLK